MRSLESLRARAGRAARCPARGGSPARELNYAENMLAPLRRRAGGRRPDRADAVAVVHSSELRELHELTWGELSAQVAAAAGGLRALGVGRGDRVVAYMPNIPETLVAFLATASIGAIWSSAAPEFGARSVIDRFAQIEPKVLFDGRRLPPRRQGLRPHGRRAGRSSPSCRRSSTRVLLAIPRRRRAARARTGGDWPGRSCCSAGDGAELAFEQVPFDHPLWVLYSSGTTGLPKAIVQGHGGILVEQLKKRMHLDLRPGDRMFWFTTTGWMMWNFLVGCLLSDAAIVLYDGSPGAPRPGRAVEPRRARAGSPAWASAPGLLASCEKAGVEPAARPRPERAARDRLDRLAAGAGELPLGLRARRRRHLAVLHQRRHRRLHGVRRRLPAAAGLRGRTAVPRARLRGRGLGRARPRARRSRSASW